MLRSLLFAASASALAVAGCADDEASETRTADAGMDAETEFAETREERTDPSEAGLRNAGVDSESGVGERAGSDMSGAEGDPDAPQSEAVSDFTYGSDYAESGMGESPPMDAMQIAAEAVGGLSGDALENLSAEQYVRQVQLANMLMIEAGRIAAERAGEPSLRTLGEEIVETHENQTESLNEAIETAGLDVDPPEDLTERGQEMVDALNETATVNFDPVFVRMQSGAHEAMGRLHLAYADSGEEEVLKTFAEASAELASERFDQIRNDHEAALDPN
ncbi:MAG: DUF4142 domain-containing protein [Oceanicaulis sp.]